MIWSYFCDAFNMFTKSVKNHGEIIVFLFILRIYDLLEMIKTKSTVGNQRNLKKINIHFWMHIDIDKQLRADLWTHLCNVFAIILNAYAYTYAYMCMLFMPSSKSLGKWSLQFVWLHHKWKSCLYIVLLPMLKSFWLCKKKKTKASLDKRKLKEKKWLRSIKSHFRFFRWTSHVKYFFSPFLQM